MIYNEGKISFCGVTDVLKVFDSLELLDFRQLMDVYEQWNQLNGALLYPNLPSNLQILYSEQDFYYFLKEFFKMEDSRYFLWDVEARYKAALRVEPYIDGWLIEALETIPADRQKGYATKLLRNVLRYMQLLGAGKIYAHIKKDNIPSLSTHKNCGFEITQEDAVFIDASCHSDHYTLMCIL